MVEIIKFKPRSHDAQRNYEDFVSSAKSLPFLRPKGIDWNSDRWDLDGLAKPERSAALPVVTFGKTKGGDDRLEGAMGEFARAYVAYKIAESLGAPKQIMKYTAPIARMRTLQQAMREAEVSCPTNLTPEIFDVAVDKLKLRSKTKNGLAQLNRSLKWVFETLSDGGMFQTPFDWRPALLPQGRAIGRSRINPEKTGRSFTSDELAAIAQAFDKAISPREEVITSLLALLCCVPARIEELLDLPVNCDVSLDPGQGFKAGLRWWPKKGGSPQVKWVPDAMLPIARKALDRIKLHTSPARCLASRALSGEIKIREPSGWPIFSESSKLNFNEALFVTPLYLVTGKHAVDETRLERLTYYQVRRAILGDSNTESVFERLGIRLPDGSPVTITTHMARHYLNSIANKASVPAADIALWSGRKNLRHNAAYDHETAEEMVDRIRKAMGPEKLPSIPIEDEKLFDVSQIKETAHTTQFGWCIQSLRQSPCQMFGQCLNCQHLMCVKGATGKLENIRSELDREIHLRAKAIARQAEGLKIDPRWMKLFDQKIVRLEQLVTILESEEVVDGSPVFLSESNNLPQFDPVAFGKAASNSALRGRGDGNDEKHSRLASFNRE